MKGKKMNILDEIKRSRDMEPETLAPDGEYQLVVNRATYYVGGSGKKMIMLNFGFVRESYQEFLEVLFLPDGEDPKNDSKNLRRIAEFNRSFGADESNYNELGSLYDGQDSGELYGLVGLSGWAKVINTKDKNGDPVNKIKGSPFSTGGYLPKR